MNKLIIGLVTGVLLLFSWQMSAQPVVSISPQNSEVAVNQDFSVDVVVSNFSDVASFQFPVVWNPDVVEYVSVSNINSEELPGFSETLFGYNPEAPGKLTVLWFEPNFSGVNLDDDTRIFTINFRSKQDGTTQIAITNDPPGIEVTAPDETELGLTPQNATVKVGTGIGPIGSTLDLRMNNQNAEVGQEVCLRVLVDGFADVSQLDFSVEYDAALLQFTGARNFNGGVSGLDAASIANPSPGVLRFGWSGGGGASTLPEGAVLLELCFEGLAEGNAPVRFTNNPVAIAASQLVEGQPQDMTVNTNNGRINVSSGNTGVEGFQLRMPNAVLEPGENFCLPVRVNDFADIVGLQFTVRYDPNLLEFDQAANFNGNVPELGEGNLSNPSPGIIRFQWNDGGFTGVDLTDGAALFELCFTARNAGSTAVTFSDDPLAIEVTQKVGSDDQQLLDFTVQNATVTIQGDVSGPGFSGFGLYLEDRVVESGEQVCLPVRVQDFDRILGMQFSIQYDPDVLQIDEVRNFGLNGLSSGNIGMPSPGAITLVWDDPAVTGQTLADGSVLFDLCFTVTGNNGTSSVVSFENSPTPVEFIQVVGDNETTIDFSFRDGFVIVGSGSFDGFGLLIGDETVESGADFCVPITVQEFEDILGMQFSIAYNPNLLQYNSVQNFGLNGLSDGSVGNPSPGAITLVWDDPAVTGQTLNDGDVLLEICFTALGPNGATTFLALADSPTPIEFIQVIDNDEQVIDYGSKVGIITIGEDELEIAPEAPDGDPGGGTIVLDVACFGESSGAIALEVSGGAPPYSYQWSYQNATSKDLNNIPASTYSVTVTDDDGAMVTASYTVEQPAAALGADIQVTESDCGAQNGSITLAVLGGTAPYTINWGGDLPNDETEQTGLAAGEYTVTITDANGCTFSPGPITVDEQGDTQITLTPEFIAPDTGGSITADVTGDAPFTFAWTGPGGFTSQEQNLSGLQTEGEYCLTATDVNGCSTTACVTVFSVLRFAQVDVSPTCAGEANGRIEVSMEGGLPPFTYQWSQGNADGPVLDNLEPGTYGLTVTDDKGDQINGNFEVTQLSAIELTAEVKKVTGSATAANGEIDLNISGGRPGYTISWDNGATGTQLTGLEVGNYCVTVTDQNNCGATACYEVRFEEVPLSFETQTQPVSCAGESDGQLTLSIQGGSTPYEVTFSDGGVVNSNSGVVQRGDLPSGQVGFTIRDADNTSIEGSAQITAPSAIEITEANIIHDTDAPGCTGSIRLSISGGTPGYNVLWNSPNTGAQIINLCEGDFVPTIADANGCTQTFAPIVINTFSVGGEVTNAACPADANGAIQLNVAGGMTPYTYRWTNSAGESLAGNDLLSDVLPGNYRVTITEGSGNELVREFVVGSVSNISVAVEVLTDFNGFGVSCAASEDGVLRATAENGTGEYMYEWTRGEEMIGAEAELSDLPGGTYEVTAIDEGGCVVATEVELSAPPEIIIAETITDVSCTGSTDGEIEVRATGGAGSDFYIFEWDNGVSGNRLTRLRAGSYTVTATDAFDCRTERTLVVEEPDPLVVVVDAQPATDGCNGTAEAVVTGGTAPFFFTWNSTGTSALITDLCPGTYSVQVTDSRGCTPDEKDSMLSGDVSDRRFPCMEAVAVITPNGDGDNELFLINCIEEFPDNQLEVYNRWGQLVYEAQNYDNSWGGTDPSGDVLVEGAYYYVLQYTDGSGNPQQLKGSLTLLRDY